MQHSPYFSTPSSSFQELGPQYKIRRRTSGFTLVELIGVLAILAILIALIVPQIFSQISKSKVTALAQYIPVYRTALLAYYSHIGSLLPLNASGIPTIETTGNSAVPTSLPSRLTLDASDPLNTGANQWPKFRGPYLEQFNSANPVLGTSMFMPSTTAVAFETSVTTTNLGWDLDAQDGLSDLPTGSIVVYLQIVGISQNDFLHLNNILDGGTSLAKSYRPVIDPLQPPVMASLVAGGGGPPPPANSVARGQVKYDAATETVLIYLAHR